MSKPKSFTAWLKTYAADPNWPSRKGRQGQLDYFEGCGAIDAAIETLERAWTQYEGP